MSTSTSSSYAQTPTLQTSSSPPSQYDMDGEFDPMAYARTMYQHTKKQMEAAARLARRRANSDGTNAHASLEHDATGSVSSMDSARSAAWADAGSGWNSMTSLQSGPVGPDRTRKQSVHKEKAGIGIHTYIQGVRGLGQDLCGRCCRLRYWAIWKLHLRWRLD